MEITRNGALVDEGEVVTFSSWSSEISGFTIAELSTSMTVLNNLDWAVGDAVTIDGWKFVVDGISEQSTQKELSLRGISRPESGKYKETVAWTTNNVWSDSSTAATAIYGELPADWPTGRWSRPWSGTKGTGLVTSVSGGEGVDPSWFDNWDLTVTADPGHGPWSGNCDFRITNRYFTYFDEDLGITNAFPIFDLFGIHWPATSLFETSDATLIPEDKTVVSGFASASARGVYYGFYRWALHNSVPAKDRYDLFRQDPGLLTSFSISYDETYRGQATFSGQYKEEKGRVLWPGPSPVSGVIHPPLPRPYNVSYHCSMSVSYGTCLPTYTVEDCDSWCAAHRKGVVQTAIGLRCVDPTPHFITGSQLTLGRNDIITISQTSDLFSFSGVALDLYGSGDDHDTLYPPLTSETDQENMSSVELRQLGSSFSLLPYAFVQPKDPDDPEGPFDDGEHGVPSTGVSYFEVLYPYSSLVAGYAMLVNGQKFGNKAGAVQAGYFGAGDGYGKHILFRDPDSGLSSYLIPFKSVPFYVYQNQAETALGLAKQGPIWCLQDINPTNLSPSPSYLQWTLELPYVTGKNLFPGSNFLLDLAPSFYYKQRCMVTAQTVDLLANKVTVKVIMQRTGDPVTPIEEGEFAPFPDNFVPPSFGFIFPLQGWELLRGGSIVSTSRTDVAFKFNGVTAERVSLLLIKDSQILSIPCTGLDARDYNFDFPSDFVSSLTFWATNGRMYLNGSDVLEDPLLAEYFNPDGTYREGCGMQIAIDAPSYPSPVPPPPPPTPTWHLISGTEVTPTKTTGQYYSCHQFEVNGSTRLSGTLDITKGLFVEINGEAFFSPSFEGSLKTVLNASNGFLRAATSSWTTSYPNNWGAGGVYLVNNRSRSVQEWYLTDEMYEKFNNDEVTIRVWYNAEAELY